MSCSAEITENKIDFWGYQRAEKRKMKSCWMWWENQRKEEGWEEDEECGLRKRGEEKRDRERKRERNFLKVIINAFWIFYKTLKIVVDWHVSHFTFCRMKILKWSGSDILIYRETCHLLV